MASETRENARHSNVPFYGIKGHIVTGITSIRKRRIQRAAHVELTLFVCRLRVACNEATIYSFEDPRVRATSMTLLSKCIPLTLSSRMGIHKSRSIFTYLFLPKNMEILHVHYIDRFIL